MLKHYIKEYPNGKVADFHQHHVAQIVYIHHGCAIAHSNDNAVVIVSGQLLWIPSKYLHELRVVRQSKMSIMHCDSAFLPAFSDSMSLLSVTPLWVQLIENFANRSDFMMDAIGRAYSHVFYDQLVQQEAISGGKTTSITIDKRLLPIIEKISTKPNIKDSLSNYSTVCSASERTLNRLFKNTFDMPFSTWRRNVVMEKALQLYRQGISVTDIALDLGYNSLSAFLAVFNQYRS